jgi:hypothetical protein
MQLHVELVSLMLGYAIAAPNLPKRLNFRLKLSITPTEEPLMLGYALADTQPTKTKQVQG